GKLGNGGLSSQVLPVPVSGAFDFVHSGTRNSCAVRLGQGYCWGSNAAANVVGNPGADQLTPTVLASSPWTWFGIGGNHSCGVSGANTYCWGLNDEGQLGSPRTTSSLQALAGFSQVAEIS